MTQPPAWPRQADFTEFSATYPSRPHRGDSLDAEFNAAKATVDAIRANLALIQRDDGALRNAIVSLDSLSDEVRARLGLPALVAVTPLNVLSYGAVGDGIADDTAAVQSAVTAALVSGRSLFVPAGRYSVTELDFGGYLQGRIDIYGEAESWFVARTANKTVVTIGSGESRLGTKGIRRIKVDGNGLSGITGIKMGDPNRALLHCHLEDVFVQFCETGFDIGNIQESVFGNCIARLCATGWIIETDETAGGATTLLFHKPAAQECYVGFLGISNSVYPVSTWQLNQPLFQGNGLCGMSLHGAVDGNGTITSTSIITPHFEGNGLTTAEGTTVTIRGKTVLRAALHLNGASNVQMLSGLGDGQATITLAKLRNGSLLDVVGGDLAAGDKSLFDCDASSRVATSGMVAVGGIMNGIADWSGIYVRPGGVRGSIVGAAVRAPSAQHRNRYGGSGAFPDAPEAAFAAGCTASKIIDAYQGQIQRVVYGAAAGSNTVNKVQFKITADQVNQNDHIATAMLVRATAATNLGLYVLGNVSQLRGPAVIGLTTDWQLVAIFGRCEANEASGFDMYAYPIGTDAPTVEFSKMMTVISPAADGDVEAVNSVLRGGLYDNMRQTIFADAAPTSGTWRVGQFVQFRVPTAGGFIGAVCTTAGTPGTWKNVAAIAA